MNSQLLLVILDLLQMLVGGCQMIIETMVHRSKRTFAKNYFCTVSIFVLSFTQHEDRFRVGSYTPAPSKIRVSQIQEP